MFVTKYRFGQTGALIATAVVVSAMACSDQGTEAETDGKRVTSSWSPSDDIKALYRANNVSRFMKELVDLGPRVAGGPVEHAAANQIESRFQSLGLATTIEEYPVATYWKDNCNSQLTFEDTVLNPIPVAAMTFSPHGNVTAPVIYVELGFPEDYQRLATGKTGYLALIERGVIPFAFKAQYALEAGAAGAIVINYPSSTVPSFNAATAPLPIGGITREDGDFLLEKLAENPNFQATLHVDTERTLGLSRQVVGTLTGTAPSNGTLYLTAHYDSVGLGPRATPTGALICPYVFGDGSFAASPGANDNASGTAAIIEAARVLTTGHRMKASVKFIAFGAEEVGLTGSLAYVLAHRNEVRDFALGNVNLDMVGVGQYLLMGNLTSPPNLVEFAIGKAAAMGIDAIPTGLPQSSDHAAFEWSGVPTLTLLRMVGEELGPYFMDDPNYHQPTDTFDKVSPTLVETAGELATGVAYEFAKNPALRTRKALTTTAKVCEPPCNHQ
jgi:aminopeptidase YwaD